MNYAHITFEVLLLFIVIVVELCVLECIWNDSQRFMSSCINRVFFSLFFKFWWEWVKYTKVEKEHPFATLYEPFRLCANRNHMFTCINVLHRARWIQWKRSIHSENVWMVKRCGESAKGLLPTYNAIDVYKAYNTLSQQVLGIISN